MEHEDRPRKQFWEVMVEERKPELLYTGDKGITEFALSPGGERIAFISNTTGDPNDYHLNDLFVLDLPPLETEDERKAAETREEPEPAPLQEPRRVTSRPGGKFSPQWSPDGSVSPSSPASTQPSAIHRSALDRGFRGRRADQPA